MISKHVPDEGLAVQASYQMSDGETIEREVKALVALHGLYPLKRAMIITYEDERNGLLDELGKYGNISWSEDEYGAVNIAFEGVDLLKNGMFNEIDIYQDPQTEFYIPFWAKNARYEYNEEGQKLVVPESIQDALIYDLYRPVSSEINTDIGGLRATLIQSV